MFIEWFNSLTTEATCVFIYMVVVGCVYGLNATLTYLSAIVAGEQVSNDVLGITLLFTWWFSVIYWFIF